MINHAAYGMVVNYVWTEKHRIKRLMMLVSLATQYPEHSTQCSALDQLRYVHIVDIIRKQPSLTFPIHNDYSKDPDTHSFCDPNIDTAQYDYIEYLLRIAFKLLGVPPSANTSVSDSDSDVMHKLSPVNGWYPSVHPWSSRKQHGEVKLMMLIGNRTEIPKDVVKLICGSICTPLSKKRKRE